MKARIRQQEIAKELGVSRTTVAYALNPKLGSRLHPDTRQRVLDTVQRMGYRPHRHAQLMNGMKSGVIGLIQSSAISQFVVQRAMLIANSIYSTGYQMLASDVMWFPQGINAAITAMLDAHVEGVVLSSPSEWFPSAELARLRAARIPVVAIDGVSMAGVPQVRADFRQGMFDLTEHVLKLGHRRLVHLTMELQSLEDEAQAPLAGRVMGFQDALARCPEATGEIVTRDAADMTWDDPYRNGHAAMSKLLKSGKRPDVVLCSNDDWALGALRACSAAGLRVPEDMAITGFDNALFSAYGETPITSVGQPVEQMAIKAVEILGKLLRGETLSESEVLIQLPCELVVRQSCGANQMRGGRHVNAG